jgi:hypothetical protein
MIYFLLKHSLVPGFARKFALRFTNFQQRMELMSKGVAKTVANQSKKAAE